MNRYWFKIFFKHLSILYDFLKFPCLVVKTGFELFYLLKHSAGQFFILGMAPRIYLPVGCLASLFGEPLSNDKNNFWRIFFSVLGTPHILYLSFWS